MANRARRAKHQRAQERARKKNQKRSEAQARRARSNRSGVFALPGMVPSLPEGAAGPPDALEDRLDIAPPEEFRREMERVLRGLIGTLEGNFDREETPLDRAQALVEDAFDAEGPERLRLARRALEISSDCADAYVLLAEAAGTPETAVPLYREGVAAGRRAIGRKAFRELKGHFWLALETRPYMRALMGLAQTLWQTCQYDEALAHYRDMLVLNPNDNQGVRYVLAAALAERERNEELAALLRENEGDGSADLAYAAALLAFRTEGNSPEARKRLEAAYAKNPFVPVYLLGDKRVPHKLPGYISPGEDSEAMSHAVGFARSWHDTPGALTWLRETLPHPAARARPRGCRQSHDPAEGVAELPLTDQTWQMDIRRAPDVGSSPDRGEPPWLVCVVESESGHPMGVKTSTSRPSPSAAWACLVEAMLHPQEEEPHRPAVVEVRLKSVFNGIARRLYDIGVDCELVDRVEAIDQMLMLGREIAERMTGSAEDVAESDLVGLPQVADEIWQADARLLAMWIGGGNAPRRPWCILISNRNEDLILRHELLMEPPEPARLWVNLATAMVRPAAGEPHRPGVLELCSPEMHEYLRPRLEPLGVRCVVRDDLDHVDGLCQGLVSQLGSSQTLTALVDTPGVQIEQVGALFEAAASFHRQRPWRDVPGDTPVRIECDGLDTRQWHAVVMGQMGMTQGVAVYDDAKALAEMLRDDSSDQENLRRSSGLSLIYLEAFEIAPTDLAAAEKHGWSVAGPEAFPGVVRLNRGGSVRSPLAWELGLVTAVLLAVPEFLKRGGAPLETTVPTGAGSLTLRLSWPPEGAFP